MLLWFIKQYLSTPIVVFLNDGLSTPQAHDYNQNYHKDESSSYSNYQIGYGTGRRFDIFAPLKGNLGWRWGN
jgi:hypothetical protein